MRLLEGTLPDGKMWRTMVLISAEMPNVVSLRLAQAISRAHKGGLLIAVFVPENSTETLKEARVVGETLEAMCEPEDKTTLLIVEATEKSADMHDAIEEADIDLIIIDAEANWRGSLNNLPCTVAALRGSQISEDVAERPLRRILVPTAGGPSTTELLRILRRLPKEYTLDVLYVARSGQVENELSMGRHRMRQLVQSLDAENRIDVHVVEADSIIEGILEQLAEGYDLVVIGATNESSVDQFLFGNIVDAVVRTSKTPVVVARQPARPFLQGTLAWLDYQMQRVVPHLAISDRARVYMTVRRNARPDQDYYVLITLSAAIAALGLLQGSPAVVIGAMLVAPLMSPMIGTGMAIVLGDLRYLRFSLGAAMRGMLITLGVGLVIGLVAGSEELTAEVLSRTQPTFIDLLIALFSGFAGAFAVIFAGAAAALPGVAIAAALVPPLASSGIAFSQGYVPEGIGGLLLFITNFVAISSASSLTFLVFGFRPKVGQKARRAIQQQTSRIAFGLLIGIGILLLYFTVTLAREDQMLSDIQEIAHSTVEEVDTYFTAFEMEFEQVEVENFDDESLPLVVGLRLQSTDELPQVAVTTLRDVIGRRLEEEVGLGREMVLELTVFDVTKPDPYLPPPDLPATVDP